MNNFKDFFFSKGSNELALPPPQKTSELAITAKIRHEMSVGGHKHELAISQINEFSEKVSQLVHSESFIQNFSDSIGKPQPNESEDQFVGRAKNIMKKLLIGKMESN
jgi:hypothetical protein